MAPQAGLANLELARHCRLCSDRVGASRDPNAGVRQAATEALKKLKK